MTDTTKPYATKVLAFQPESKFEGRSGTMEIIEDPVAATPVTAARRLFMKHDELCSKARDLMRQKNHDYRGGGGDPYANFRSAPQLGITPVQGILLRMNDKMMRVKTFDEKGELQVKDEGLEDALIDIINYAVLIGGLIQEEKYNDNSDESGPARS